MPQFCPAPLFYSRMSEWPPPFWRRHAGAGRGMTGDETSGKPGLRNFECGTP
jgi:hypothetical protein